MAKKIFAVVAIVLIASIMFGGVLSSAIFPNNMSAEEVKPVETSGTIFFDASAYEVQGCDAEAEGHWLLSDGEYNVLCKDGTNKNLIVDSGSWYFAS